MLLDLFKTLKVSKKIALIFLMLYLMMGTGGSLGLYNAWQIVKVAEMIYSTAFKRAETLSGMERELILKQNIVLTSLITEKGGDAAPLDKALSKHNQRIRSLLSEHYSYEKHLSAVSDLYAAFEQLLKEQMELEDELLDLVGAGNLPEALILTEGELKASYLKSLETLQVLLEEDKGLAYVAFLKSHQLGMIITLVTITFIILALLLAYGLWRILTASIVKPVEAIEEAARKIANGNMNERVPVFSHDEIGELATEFNRMAKNLEDYYATLENQVEERTKELKEANEELSRRKRDIEIANEDLVRANKMKSQFLANVSHELRTPLNSIIGFSELLQDSSFGSLNEKQLQYTKYIYSSGSHLLQLINNILDLSKIEAGRLELKLEKINISDMIGEVLGAIKPIAHKRNITVKCKKSEVSNLIIMADMGKFKQILLNLFSNAVKFNKENGVVEVDWTMIEEGESTHLSVTISDTGMGIHSDDLSRIFKEFEQLDASITREYGGTGLGLTLTKRLVELHGGAISVESEVGVGSKFIFTIPQYAVKPSPSRPAAIISQAKQDALPLIILASESRELNELLRVYLENAGYAVDVANDGEEILRKAADLRPFAIAMGISIPKKDGWEVLKELKEAPEVSDIPVIILSASNNRELGFGLGAVDYLTKPIDREGLLESLRRLSYMKRVKRGAMKVLIVDDDPNVVDLLSSTLDKEGFLTLAALSGEDGISMAKERIPDLIILDLMMPVVSGFDVVEELRMDHLTREIPIIIFTAKEITEEDKEKLGNNIGKIIKKGHFSREDLLKEITLLELAYPVKAKMVDPLTRAFNLRYFKKWIYHEISRSERSGKPFSMLVIDIDRFSDYNNKHGYIAGNDTLIEMARLIEKNVRASDCLIRYGGDEFMLFLPAVMKEAALHVAEKLRVRIERHTFHQAAIKGRLTVSVAVFVYPSDGKDPEEAVKTIDRLIKDGLNRGGNTVLYI